MRERITEDTGRDFWDEKTFGYNRVRFRVSMLRGNTPDWQPWVLFFLHMLGLQKQRLEKKIERERTVFEILPTLSLRILELAKDHGRITISEIVTFSGANRNTVKKHLHDLVADNHLAQHGRGRGTWYALP